MKEENPFESAIKTATETIVKELYSDIKKWALTAISPAQKVFKNLRKKRYSSINDLLSDISIGKLKNGSLVEIQCKFSSFGPFIKPLYISPLVGVNTQNRLGPPLQHPNPIMGMVAQTTSNLTPVGIYPTVSDLITQVRLYPSESEAMGFFGLFPGIGKVVLSFNALIKTEYLNDAHKSCRLTGKIRCITQQDFIRAGYKLEDYEIVRSVGNIWFLEATDEDSDCQIVNNDINELWGGLYSAGHVEFKGNIPIKPLIDGYLDKLNPIVEDLRVVQNQAKNKEINLFGKGFRMVQHINFPVYAIHYDIDVAKDYSNQKDKYERILTSVLQNIKDTCDHNSTELMNPFDLDFNYSNSEQSYKILESIGAKNIEDPLALAIRQWTKRKN